MDGHISVEGAVRRVGVDLYVERPEGLAGNLVKANIEAQQTIRKAVLTENPEWITGDTGKDGRSPRI